MRRRRVPGVVVLVLDSGLTSYARALTPDSGTFSIVGALGRFHLKVMRIGFRPTESRVFSLSRDTTVQLELADIPVVLPRVTTRDRNDCRLHPDTSDAAALTFALWDQARTALLATDAEPQRRLLPHLRRAPREAPPRPRPGRDLYGDPDADPRRPGDR
jgi:hypothetical protein